MARRPRSPQLETRTTRLKLAVRKKPYTVSIAPGIHLAYRRNLGPGVWSAKASDGHGGHWLKKFAIADDHEESNGESVLTFWQAQDKARTIARGGEGSGDRPVTVAEALDAYEADLLARGADIENATRIRFNMPKTLAAKAVALLTAKELRTWRNRLVEQGMKPASADRVGRAFKAALNLAAADDPRIVNAKAWKDGLTSLPDGENARNVILPDKTVSAVVRTAYEVDRDLGVFIETLAGTGARESQVCKLEVHDLLDNAAAPRLMMPSSRKGRKRRVERKPLSISPRLASVLRQAAAGRAPNALLLDKITRLDLRFRVVAKRLNLDPEVTAYALRHSSIVRQLLAGIPTRVVASFHDTSVAMIEKTYSRDIIGDPTDTMTRRTLLDFGTPADAADNVVPITGR
jgi:integrase